MRLRPPTEGARFGANRGTPILEVELVEGEVPDTDGEPVWRVSGEIPLPDGPVAYDQRLMRTGAGAFVLRTNGSAVHVDVDRGRLTIQAERESMYLQLVTTYGVPLLLHSAPVLVLHACSAIPPGRDDAVVVCGASGTGKSSVLVGLIEAGWRALSEDVSVVDLRDGAAVWPGPPWVRSTGAGPRGTGERFRTPDKTAWDIAPHQSQDPTPISDIVFLERPGGATIEIEGVDRAEAIGRLARSAIWLIGSEGRASATFGPCVDVAGAGPATRLRLPVEPDWLDRAVSVLDEISRR